MQTGKESISFNRWKPTHFLLDKYWIPTIISIASRNTTPSARIVRRSLVSHIWAQLLALPVDPYLIWRTSTAQSTTTSIMFVLDHDHPYTIPCKHYRLTWFFYAVRIYPMPYDSYHRTFSKYGEGALLPYSTFLCRMPYDCGIPKFPILSRFALLVLFMKHPFQSWFSYLMMRSWFFFLT